MERTVTVRGVGKASVRPDTAVLNLELSALDENYDAATALAEKQIRELRESFCSAGFDKDDIKTVDFRVSAERKSVRDKDGNYSSVFAGYRCSHSLTLGFALDSERLGKAVAAASCAACPEFNVAFTVKDKSAVSASVLESAARSAREKASVLAAASGVKLGELVKIDYDFAELDVQSPARYLACKAETKAAVRSMDIRPDDIVVSDSVGFTWKIE